MSSAFYPQNMKNYNNTKNKGYISWKGQGINRNPIGSVRGNLRPFTNKDYSNNIPGTFGLPRPMKHYRKGRSVVSTYIPEEDRTVKSSINGKSITDIQDNPGSYIIHNNDIINHTNNDCGICNRNNGNNIVSSYYPNESYLTENPIRQSQTVSFNCNAEKKARRRIMSGSTNIKKNYFTTLHQYRQNRCKTFDQKSFNFEETNDSVYNNTNNIYRANCKTNREYYDNITGETIKISGVCDKVIYKPSNKQFARQGAVSSSTRNLKLNVDTIDKNASLFNNTKNIFVFSKNVNLNCR